MIAELKAASEDQDERLKMQAEIVRTLELKLVEVAAASDQRSDEERRTCVQLAEHQIAIAELRLMKRGEQAKVIDLPEALQRRGLN